MANWGQGLKSLGAAVDRAIEVYNDWTIQERGIAADKDLQASNQTFQKGLVAEQQAFSTKERKAGQVFDKDIIAGDQKFKTSERLGEQAYDSAQNELDRIYEDDVASVKQIQDFQQEERDRQADIKMEGIKQKNRVALEKEKAKTAGSGPSSPTKTDFSIAKTVIDSDPELADIENLEQFTLAVASRTKELMKKNKVGAFDAARQALAELKQKIKPAEKTTSMFGWNLNPFNDKGPRFDPDMGGKSIREGATAINPETGQKIILRNSKWIAQ